MKIVAGDLLQLALDDHFDVIIHGCNCFCTMGAGIAASIRLEFPEALSADADTKKGIRINSGVTAVPRSTEMAARSPSLMVTPNTIIWERASWLIIKP